VDAGLKSYSAERGPPWVHDRPDVEVTGVSDEHGKLKVGPRARPLSLGEKLCSFPGPSVPTANRQIGKVVVRTDPVRRCGRSTPAAPASEGATREGAERNQGGVERMKTIMDRLHAKRVGLPAKLALAALIALAGGALAAEPYPDRPVTLIVPYAAGGSS